jgi:trehalose 6-phosphate synthase/phosphatase
VQRDGDDLRVERSGGGLVTGLRGPHERSQGLWVGWPGDVSSLDERQQRTLSKDLEDMRCAPVYLTTDEVTRYYDGFSNGVLWPLFHYLLDRIPPHSKDWEVYRAVNEKFTDAIVAVYRPDDLVWVHDYQLTLVPQMLRARIPNARIGYFLHIPFPATEVLRTLPWREPVLEGLLGADILGFHTFRYRSHFCSSVLRILGIPTQGDSMRVDGREIRVGVFPIGVDAPNLLALAESPGVADEVATIRAEARGERILLGIDRLDYTKGIPRRLLAFERMLEIEPTWRGKVRLVQVAVPSRIDVPSYQEFRS